MKFKVPAHSSIPYTWDEPHGDHRIEVKIGDEVRQFNLDKVKKYPPPQVRVPAFPNKFSGPKNKLQSTSLCRRGYKSVTNKSFSRSHFYTV